MISYLINIINNLVKNNNANLNNVLNKFKNNIEERAIHGNLYPIDYSINGYKECYTKKLHVDTYSIGGILNNIMRRLEDIDTYIFENINLLLIEIIKESNNHEKCIEADKVENEINKILNKNHTLPVFKIHVLSVAHEFGACPCEEYLSNYRCTKKVVRYIKDDLLLRDDIERAISLFIKYITEYKNNNDNERTEIMQELNNSLQDYKNSMEKCKKDTNDLLTKM